MITPIHQHAPTVSIHFLICFLCLILLLMLSKSVIDKGFNKMPVSPPPPMNSPLQNTLERILEDSVPFWPFGAHTHSLVPRTPPSSKVTGWQSFRTLISARTHTECCWYHLKKYMKLVVEPTRNHDVEGKLVKQLGLFTELGLLRKHQLKKTGASING